MPNTPETGPAHELLRLLARPLQSDAPQARGRAIELLRAPRPESHDEILVAAAAGDAPAVRRLLDADPALATRRGGPLAWDALTHLCFSVLLGRIDEPGRDFVGAATALLDAGASALTGFDQADHVPEQSRAPVLYGAAGLAHHAGLSRLLLARGADPNDEEVSYHAPEGYDNAAMQALVESGRMTPDSLATLLLRKLDWHDLSGVRWLLERGADPSRETRWTPSMLHHALSRDNDLEIVQLLLDHGADPARAVGGVSAIAAAAGAGRGDVLDAMARRGIALRIDGADALLAACARGHGPAVHTIADARPDAVTALQAHAGTVLARFAGNGNSAGLRLLLDLGLPVDARFEPGFGYFDIAPMSTSLHVAAWRGRPTAVRVLLEAGADANARDGHGRTPVSLAVRACVDSYWTDRRTPESVELLLAAGATPRGIATPCGYEAVDDLLARASAD